jgi:hypothetical protein
MTGSPKWNTSCRPSSMTPVRSNQVWANFSPGATVGDTPASDRHATPSRMPTTSADSAGTKPPTTLPTTVAAATRASPGSTPRG